MTDTRWRQGKKESDGWRGETVQGPITKSMLDTLVDGLSPTMDMNLILSTFNTHLDLHVAGVGVKYNVVGEKRPPTITRAGDLR